MTSMRNALAAAGIGASLLALSTTGASVAIACRGNICWHVYEHFAYPPAETIVVHPDYWRPPTARIVIEPEGWSPVQHFGWRGYEVGDYYGGDRWTEW
jgi:hypothetical protein